MELAMGWDAWARLDGLALAELVRRGELTAEEAVAQGAAAVSRLEPRLQGLLGFYEDVLEDPGHDRPNHGGVLYGVPMLLKDIGSALAGRVQESGTRLLRGFVAPVTDPAVANFLAAGLIPIGRSTTPEFGMTFDTCTDYLGTLKVTRNPWNLERTPGGSSGGSAAMVAAGALPLSMANDGGGSIRIPAAFCGLVGLKASRGRVPRPVNSSEYMGRIAIEGVVSRSVRDTAAAFETLPRTPTGGSFIAMGPPRGSYLAAIARPPRPLRVGLTAGTWGRATPVDPEVAARMQEVAALLGSLGHAVETFGDSFCDWNALWWGYRVQWIGSRAQFATTARTRGIDPAALREHLGPMVWRHYEASARHDKFDIWKMMECNNTVTRQFGALMDRYDVLLTPTMAIRVPAANGPYSLLRDDIDIDAYVDLLCDACRFTMPGNETGLPGISVPAGLDSDGLPIGAQFYATFGAEDLLLQLAAQVEAARPEWFGARPPVHVTAG